MKIIIVGAGISGLYAGYLLCRNGMDIQIFEAEQRCGGRIHSQTETAGDFHELGAEIIHGDKSALHRLFVALGIRIHPAQGKALYWYDGKLRTFSELKGTPARRLLQDLDDIEDYTGDEISLENHIRQKKYYSENLDDLFQAFAGEYGTTGNFLGLKSLAAEENTWNAGNDNYYMARPMQTIVEHLLQPIQGHVKLNTKIVNIHQVGHKIHISDQNGEQHQADKVILSVPLGVLKAGDIRFEPLLPEAKQKAIQTLGYDRGMKVILKFSQRWWDADLLVIEGGAICPEYLVSHYDQQPRLSGFIMGCKTDGLEKMSSQALGSRLVAELDKMFQHKKASQNLTAVFIKDWGIDPCQRGVYSFASPDSVGQREILAQSIQDQIYFIGEACNLHGHAASIHGAMETAEQTCQEILGYPI